MHLLLSTLFGPAPALAGPVWPCLGFRVGLGSRTRRVLPARACGGVPEWSNGAVSKTVVRVTVPWVRIPPPPPVSRRETDSTLPIEPFFFLFQRCLRKPSKPRRLSQRQISVSERLSSLSDRTSSKSVRFRKGERFQSLPCIANAQLLWRLLRLASPFKEPAVGVLRRNATQWATCRYWGSLWQT